MEISGKIAKDFQLFLPKTLSQKPGQVPIFAKNPISEAWLDS